MELAAASLLHDATVADGKGGSRLSGNRKAKHTGTSVPWETPNHPISKVSRRVYDYTNHVLGLDIDEHGEEDLMSIQYSTLVAAATIRLRTATPHIKPKPYLGILFSYIHPDTLVIDTGFTERSGCLVSEGEKKIVT